VKPMAENTKSILPEGVRLGIRGDGPPIELVIRAANGDELAWRVHDLIPLIQSGELGRLIDAAKRTTGEPSIRPGSNS
jgi:hypothetical protein